MCECVSDPVGRDIDTERLRECDCVIEEVPVGSVNEMDALFVNDNDLLRLLESVTLNVLEALHVCDCV